MINYGGVPTPRELWHLAALGGLCRAVCRRVHGWLDLESASMATGDGADGAGAVGRPRVGTRTGLERISVGEPGVFTVSESTIDPSGRFRECLWRVVCPGAGECGHRAAPLWQPCSDGGNDVGMPCALAVCCLAAIWGYGGWRLHQTSTAAAPAPADLTVALLQGNIEQDLKWDDAAREAIFSLYRSLTLEAAADPEVDLIVWPEAATPFFFANDRVFQSRQLRLAQEAGRPLLFGSPTYARDGDQDVMYNSAFLVGPDDHGAGTVR